MAAALSFLVVFVGAHHTETRSATGPHASPIVTMAFSLCVAVGGVARAAPPRSASRSASRRSHIIRCAEPERRSGSVAPRVTRRAFGAGAALVAAGLESSTKAARAFERPPPGTSRARSRDALRARRANAALSSTSVDAKSACFFFPSRSARSARAPLRSRLFARASSLAPLRFTRLTDGDDSIVVLHDTLVTTSLSTASQATARSTTPSTGTSCSAPTTGSR